jgi:PAS domain S-box-containing protein
MSRVSLNQSLPAFGAWPLRRIAWTGGLFIAVIAALAAHDMWRGYRQAVADTRRELDAQSRVIAEQTARSVQAVDVMLHHVATEYRRGRLARLGEDELHVYLRDIAVGLNQIDGLGMFDAAGDPLAVSWPAPQRAVNMGALPRFQQLRDQPGLGFVIFGAARAAGDGPWIVPFGRRLETADGRFAGVVAARGRVEYFEHFYRDAYPDPATRVALLHRDSTLLARHPSSAAPLGQRFPALEPLLPGPDGQPRASRGISPVDGVDRFAAIRLVPDYPLVVVVTREADAALASWRSQAIGTAWRTLALGTLAALLMALLWRQLQRLTSARASLAQSQERYALAAAGSDVGVWDWDLVAGTAYESRRARELQGLPLEPETQPLDELKGSLTYHPDDAPRRALAMQAHLDGATSHYEVEYRVRRADGHYYWIHVRALCIRDATGQPLRIAGSVSDIDQRKRAEEALRVSEERYALAMTGSNEGHWLWDMRAQRIYVSAKLADLMGFDGGAQTLPDADYFERLPLHPDDRERVHFNRNEHLAGRTPRLDHEFRIVRPSGEVRWLHTRAQCFRDAEGRPLRLAGSTVDATERKRAEEALRESEARFAVAVAGSGEGLYVWNFASGRGFASAHCQRLYGLAVGPEEQPIEAWYEQARLRVHPDDQARWAATLEDHLAGRTAVADGEFRVLRDGQWRWVRTRGMCERDASGQPLRLAGSVGDIDARKRAEEALRESQQRFADAVAGSDDGIWEWNYTTGMAFGSRRGRQLLGLPPEPEVMPLAQWFAEAGGQIHPDDLPARQKAIDDHLAGRAKAYEGDFRARQPDGSYRWVHVHGRAVRDADGKVLRVAGSASDIDDRKRAEEALRESEERYALAMSGWRGGHWVCNEADDRLFVSAAVNELFGLPAETRIGSRAEFMTRITLHPDDRARVLQLIETHTRGDGARHDYECRVVLPDGSVRWILNRAQRFPAPAGRGSRVAGVIIDITERKQAELEREQLEQQLRQAQKLEAIGTLAGGIAHDFNNILSAILGYGELAQKGAPEGTPLRRHIDASLAAGQRAKSLVERILAFSRSGMGERVPVPVQAVVDEALDAVAGSLPATVTLVRRLDAADAGVLGDPTQIHQVVMNLCANAVQAMRSEGRLVVALDRVALGAPLAVATNTLAPAEYLRLAIADSGSGIAPELLARIFDPFFTTKEVGVGTGLGLSLVHGIVTDLGGGIEVQSRIGEGSRFTVYLPVYAQAVTPAADEAPGESERGQGQVVLLVDDEEALVRLGEEALAEIGYEPVGFTSSAAALEALRSDPQRFDLLLTDEAMPGLTGTELAREAHALRPGLPIVLASGYVTPALRERARAAGVAEVLSKPLATAEVARALAAALAGLQTMVK